MTTTLDSLLTDLASGAVHVVDLTAPLSPSTPVLQLPAPFANTIPLSLEPVSNFDDDGPGWGWNNIHTGEHTGTHVDAPAHWATGRDGHTVDTIPPGRLVGPAVVLDFRDEVSRDPDFLLEPAHLDAHVAEHGPLPDGAWLVFRTGWSARNHDADAFLNADDSGPHTPGVSVAGAEWLAASSITGFAVETVGVDAGQAGGMDPMFPVHYHLLGADKYGLTQLQNLDRLPATGAVLVVSPLPIVGGTGSPARVLAFVPGAA
ncbi:cyclase family protein [Rhodococcoides kroppenstedtii]|uniref:cyclase family protein n=1 Tax=Rhodococcoides kroppenstedtii TaxID=293050 RepID=UPI001BDF3CD9|nr:cyclase family protein [Rhodococcus kroppenstedtii]MBT1191582.1 cyclase family protein [Rhodococcus kroppenstedtii]